jgi:hypothetical protein
MLVARRNTRVNLQLMEAQDYGMQDPGEISESVSEHSFLLCIKIAFL